LSVDGFEIIDHQNNPEVDSHVRSGDPRVREFVFTHGDVVFYVGMKQSKVGAINQIGYTVIEADRTSKKNVEFRLNRGKFFSTKSGMFGINESSCYQFDPEIIKLAPVSYPR
jgi:hypothetical protein